MAQDTERYPIDPETRVVCETSSGDLTVRGHDAADVTVAAEHGRATVSREGQTLTVRSGRGGSEDLVVHVPQTCLLALRVASGDARLRDVEGEINFRSMSGDLHAERVQGELELSTMSGDLILTASQVQKLSAETVSGDLVIETPLNAEGTYRLHTVSGDVVLRLPPEQACTINLSSVSGGVRCKLPHKLDRQSWGNMVAQVNGGGVEVNVRSVSGGVHVEASAAEHAAQPERSAEAPRPQPAPEPQPEPQVTKPLSDEPFGLSEEETVSPAATRMEILRAIEEGRMTVTEGLAKLRELD